jgi:hypothetical protein
MVLHFWLDSGRESNAQSQGSTAARRIPATLSIIFCSPAFTLYPPALYAQCTSESFDVPSRNREGDAVFFRSVGKRKDTACELVLERAAV